MRSARNLSTLAVLLLAVLSFAACAPPTGEVDPVAAEAEATAALQQAKSALDAKRQEFNDLKAHIASDEDSEVAPGAGEGETAEGDEAPASPEERLAALEEEVDKLGEEFSGQLIDFLNAQEIYEGQEFTEGQRAAFNLKADEDILLAQEYIDKAGNYQKAIDIFTTSLLADPTNEKLLAAKSQAEELRYMTEERFGVIKKGMGQAEVRGLLGTPQTRNVREYDNGVTAWFYPREGNYAAGVFFRKRRGEFKVYDAKFDAITPEDSADG